MLGDLGSAEVFLAALVIILIWGALGPRYHYSDTWQLAINTTTTIITFLMVFIIQNTQNRDAKAIHLKLDELIRAVKGARTGLVRLEELSDDDLRSLTSDFETLRVRLVGKIPAPTAQGRVSQGLDYPSHCCGSSLENPLARIPLSSFQGYLSKGVSLRG